MNQNNSKHVVVTFMPADTDEVKMQLNINGQTVFESTKTDVFVGALHCVGTESLNFHFFPEAGDKVVPAQYPLKLESAFELVEETDGFETKKLMQLIHSSLQLHDAHKLVTRDAAVAAWKVAQSELPDALIVNRVEDLPRRPRN